MQRRFSSLVKGVSISTAFCVGVVLTIAQTARADDDCLRNDCPELSVLNFEGDGSYPTPNNSGGNTSNPDGDPNNTNQGTNNNPPPCVPPAGGLLGGVGIASIVLSPPCS